MSVAVGPREALAEILALERLRENEFEAALEDFWGSAQGGDALARAALAAADGVPGLALRSLHAHYLRPPPPASPLRLRVERLADAPGEALHQVRIERDGLVCQVVASFAVPSPGVAYQDTAPAAALPEPDALPSTHAQARAEGWSEYANGPIEFRRAHPRVWPDPTGATSGGHVEWMRPRKPLPDDPRVQTAALVFLCDFYVHWPFERRIGSSFSNERFVPLDTAIHVHRVPRWSDWWLVESISEVAHGGVALARRRVFARDGSHLATVAQAALVVG